MKEYLPSSSDEEKPLGRTLFIAKVPLYLDENDVKKLFSEVGRIVSVKLNRNKPSYNDEFFEAYMNGFQFAYVVYEKRQSLVKALNLEMLKTLADEKYTPFRGMQKYIKEYNDSIINHKLLLEDATKAINLHEKQVEKMEEKKSTVRAIKKTKLNNKLLQ